MPQTAKRGRFAFASQFRVQGGKQQRVEWKQKVKVKVKAAIHTKNGFVNLESSWVLGTRQLVSLKGMFEGVVAGHHQHYISCIANWQVDQF